MSTSLTDPHIHHHQRNFSEFSNSTTIKSEVYSAFDDDYDIPDDNSARRRKQKFWIAVTIGVLVLISASVAGGVAYMKQHNSSESTRQVLDTGSSSIISTTLDVTIDSTSSISALIAVETLNSESVQATESTSFRIVSFGIPSSTILAFSITPTSILSTPTSINSPLDPSPTTDYSSDDKVTPITPSSPSPVPDKLINDNPTPQATVNFKFPSPSPVNKSPIATPTSTPKNSVVQNQPSVPTTSSIKVSAPALPSPPALTIQLNTFSSKTSTGVLSHFPGSPLSSSPLACGDSYTTPETTLFAALCHITFDLIPGTTSFSLINPNKSPVCGNYAEGRKDFNGTWITKGNGIDFVVVGGDSQLSCVGEESVRCHIPKTITITYGDRVVKGVMVVDRNQGDCAAGDIDASDLVYRTLAGTTEQDNNAGLGSNLQNVTWAWE